MYPTAAELVSRARVVSSLTRDELALLADASLSTVTGVESGKQKPAPGMLSELLAVCGYRVGESLISVADVDSLRAGRWLLDPSAGVASTSGSENWVRRWERIGLVRNGRPTDWDGIGFRAACTSRLAARSGATRFELPAGGWRETALMLRESGAEWALTGAYAALRYTSVANAVWPVFYVDDVEDAAGRDGLTRARSSGVAVTLIPFDDVTRTGVDEYRGVRWAAPWQIVLDCHGGGGRMPDQAEAIADHLPRGLIRT